MKTTARFGMIVTTFAVVLLMQAGIVFANSLAYSEDFESNYGQSITNLTVGSNIVWYAAETNSIIEQIDYTTNYTGDAVGFPLDYDHTSLTGVLKIENGVSNVVTAGANSQTNWVDTVLRPVFADEPPEVPGDGAVAGIYFNTNGYPVIMNTPSNGTSYAEWVEITNDYYKVTEGDWIRLSILTSFDTAEGFPWENATRFYQVRINGAIITNSNAFIDADRKTANAPDPEGVWFGNRAERARVEPVTNIVIKGTGYLDDLVMTNSLAFTQKDPTYISSPPFVSSDLYYGQMLSDITLSGGSATNGAGAPVDGDFAFTNPSDVPTVGTTSVSVTFSPSNDTAYLDSVVMVDVVTWKTTPTVVWPSSASQITNGQTLADSALSMDGTATNQYSGLEATGTFAFESPSTMPPVGTDNFNVVFTPVDTDLYNTVIGTGVVAVTIVEAPGGGTTTNGTPTTWYDNLGITTNGTYPTYDDLDHADSDGDGVLNWREYVAGTLPGNSNSVFKVLSISVTPPNLTMSWMGGTNGPSSPYMLYGAASLETMPIVWTAITNQARAEGTNSVTGVDAGSNLYFRVLATPDP